MASTKLKRKVKKKRTLNTQNKAFLTYRTTQAISTVVHPLEEVINTTKATSAKKTSSPAEAKKKN